MFKRILVPLDRSSLAEQAIGPAAAIARAAHAEIDLVQVHEPLPFTGFEDAPWNASQFNDEHKYLETIAAEISTGLPLPVTHSIMRGGPVEMICRRAHDIEADLIVMTTHGRTGLSRAWLGSVADGVLRRSTIPVLMLRPVETSIDRHTAHRLFKHCLILVNDSPVAADILPYASALATCSGARISLLHVVYPVPLVLPDSVMPGMPLAYPISVPDEEATAGLVNASTKKLEEVADRLKREGFKDVEEHVVVSGRVAQAIIDFARVHSVDAIAMSTHGRGASRLLLGSVADKVLRGSRLPLLIHRPAAEPAHAAVVAATHVEHDLPTLSKV